MTIFQDFSWVCIKKKIRLCNADSFLFLHLHLKTVAQPERLIPFWLRHRFEVEVEK